MRLPFFSGDLLEDVDLQIAIGHHFLQPTVFLLELPEARLRSEGYLTVQYSDRADDGDHIVWYRRLP